MAKNTKIEFPIKINVIVQSLVLLHEEHQMKFNQICNIIEAIKQDYFSRIDLFDMMSVDGREQTLLSIFKQLGPNLFQQNQLLQYFRELEILFEQLKIFNKLFHDQLALFTDQTLNKLKQKPQVKYLIKIITSILKERMEYKRKILKFFDPLTLKSEDVYERRIKTANFDKLSLQHSFQDKTVNNIKLNNLNLNIISTVNQQNQKSHKSQKLQRKQLQQQQQQELQQQQQMQNEKYQESQYKIQQYQYQQLLQQQQYQQKQQYQSLQLINPIDISIQDSYINNQNCMMYPVYFMQQPIIYPAYFYQFNNHPIQ